MGTFPTNMNTVVANKAQEYLGDRKVLVHNVDTEKKRPGQTMKALVWHGKKDVRVDEVPVPAITDPGDVICRVTGTTVCGSDLHLYHKEIMQLQKGDILGHEWMGLVDEVGPEVKNLKKGDRVVASFQIACGQCSFCKEGLSSMCDNTNISSVQDKLYGKGFGGLFGYTRFAGGFAGGQAEYVRAPFGDVNLLKLPDSVPDEKVLYLSDNVPERLAMARDNIGCEVIDFSQTKDVVKVLYEKEPEGINCCIDAAAFRYTKGVLNTFERAVGLETDSSEIVNEMLQAVRKFGHIALVADYAGPTNGFLIGALMEKGITLRGTGQAPVQMYWHELLKKIEDGSFDPTIILS